MLWPLFYRIIKVLDIKIDKREAERLPFKRTGDEKSMTRKEDKKRTRKKSAPAGRKPKERFERRVQLEVDSRTRTQREETVELTVRGFAKGSIRMEAQDGTIFLCARENAGGALFGDTVRAERIGRDRVIVTKVLVHAHEMIMGVLRVHEDSRVILPLERKLPAEIPVSQMNAEAEDGEIVRTQVVRWEDEGGLCVSVEERIGSFNQATYALDALVMSMHLRTKFDDDVLEQANACRPAEDDPSREDLRDILSFTIDGRDAKDFDDAVSLEPLGGGRLRLGVHIADVGHYVPQGTPLDREAFERGTSVYLPGRVLPMLPEQLCNGVCSLRPNEDKYTLSALLEINENGEVVDERLVRSITRSKARLVYDDVNAFFEGGEQITETLAPVADTLMQMRDLARKLRARRQARGCIDFETEEPKFILDENGEPVEIVTRERGEAEMMIEDFMLAANECAARFARENHVPLLYRVHEKPDPEKLVMFADFLEGIGVNARKLRHRAAPGDIRAILEATRERPEYTVITTLGLRSMQKARYDMHPLGHYGLAMSDYCHFTSPIRRYPDLVVSRAITAVLTGNRVPLFGNALDDAAVRSSARERAAIDAERAADKLMMARLMAGHIGEIFEGKINGVSEYGMYVTLENGAEGFVPVRTMDDWFNFDERRMMLRGERTGMIFSLGQNVKVKVDSVELTQSSIDLSLIMPARSTPRRSARRR